jgi:hypothetical protein
MTLRLTIAVLGIAAAAGILYAAEPAAPPAAPAAPPPANDAAPPATGKNQGDDAEGEDKDEPAPGDKGSADNNVSFPVDI